MRIAVVFAVIASAAVVGCQRGDPVAELERRCTDGSKAFDNQAMRDGYLKGCIQSGKAALYSSGVVKPPSE